MSDSTDEEFVSPSQQTVNGRVQTEDLPSNKASAWLQFIICALFYVYVLICLLWTVIIPASVSPLLDHPVLLTNDTQTADKIGNEAWYVGSVLLFNEGLLLLFVLQHSYYPHDRLKKLLTYINMSAFKRLLYVFTTCIVLQIIQHFWCPIPSKYHLWSCTYTSQLFNVTMTLLHLICWASVTFSVFTFDYLELFGIKQIYYHYYGAQEPILFKALDHYELLSHMRHPLFLAPLVILWAVPHMSYNRLLLGIMVPVYMLWGNRVTEKDQRYIHDMFKKKKEFLFDGKTD